MFCIKIYYVTISRQRCKSLKKIDIIWTGCSKIKSTFTLLQKIVFWFIAALSHDRYHVIQSPSKQQRSVLCKAIHAYTFACMHSISSNHTYPRGSLIPDTCSNGTLGRKQLKDSCETQESNGNEVENVQYNQNLQKNGRLQIPTQCNHLNLKKEKEKDYCL